MRLLKQRQKLLPPGLGLSEQLRLQKEQLQRQKPITLQELSRQRQELLQQRQQLQQQQKLLQQKQQYNNTNLNPDNNTNLNPDNSTNEINLNTTDNINISNNEITNLNVEFMDTDNLLKVAKRKKREVSSNYKRKRINFDKCRRLFTILAAFHRSCLTSSIRHPVLLKWLQKPNR